MPRAGWKKTWIKLYPLDCIEGSIRYQLEPDERGVWYDLLNFSALCTTPGSIADKDCRPYPPSFIANRLNIPLDLLQRTLAKCIEEGRIHENGSGIHITNWSAYQSEYQRQRPYRGDKSKNQQQEPHQAGEPEDPNFAQICQIYEANIGQLTPIIGDRLKELADHYSPKWFEDAVKTACEANVRRLNYIKAILDRWQTEGKSGDKGKSAKPKVQEQWL